MKRKDKEPAKTETPGVSSKNITRKEALRKSGYFALTAATTMILLSTPKSASASPQSLPVW